MIRSIMFRAKRYDNKEWCYGDLSTRAGCRIEWTYINDDAKYITCCSDVCPQTVGQYTGLKDKNKKKIFEGDIISVTGVVLMVVGYGNGMFIEKQIGPTAPLYERLYGEKNLFLQKGCLKSSVTFTTTRNY